MFSLVQIEMGQVKLNKEPNRWKMLTLAWTEIGKVKKHKKPTARLTKCLLEPKEMAILCLIGARMGYPCQTHQLKVSMK